jgi:hypothetical protein
MSTAYSVEQPRQLFPNPVKKWLFEIDFELRSVHDGSKLPDLRSWFMNACIDNACNMHVHHLESYQKRYRPFVEQPFFRKQRNISKNGALDMDLRISMCVPSLKGGKTETRHRNALSLSFMPSRSDQEILSSGSIKRTTRYYAVNHNFTHKKKPDSKKVGESLPSHVIGRKYPWTTTGNMNCGIAKLEGRFKNKRFNAKDVNNWKT